MTEPLFGTCDSRLLQCKTCAKLPILILGPSERGSRLFQLALYLSQFLVRVFLEFSSANCDAY